MTTPLSEICDLFLSRINDYRLPILLTESGSANLITYLEPFLLDSIDDFESICSQTLDYDTNLQIFSVDLTRRNKNILSKIMVKYWLAKEVRDVQQMRLHLQDKDFRVFSESQNLRQKSELYDKLKEEISQDLVSYGYDNVDWTSWQLQSFS